MRLVRLIIVVVMVTVVLGAVGAGIGYLIGFGAPAAMREFLGLKNEMEVATRELPARGAAICAAMGLGAGAAAGLLIGIIDQVLLMVRSAMRNREQSGEV